MKHRVPCFILDIFPGVEERRILCICASVGSEATLVLGERYFGDGWHEWKLPLRGRITCRHCLQPILQNFLISGWQSGKMFKCPIFIPTRAHTFITCMY